LRGGDRFRNDSKEGKRKDLRPGSLSKGLSRQERESLGEEENNFFLTGLGKN